MTENIIVMSGMAYFDLEALHTVARGFGWTVGTADDLREVAAAQVYQRTTAVLFHRDAFRSCSWLEAVRRLRFALPKVRPIACHGFSESIDWPGLRDAGAFHALWLPLKENEVRQSFGFLWEAEKLRAEPAESVPMIIPARKLSATQRITPDLVHGVHARVMASAAG